MRLIDADAMREEWLENGENEYVYDTNAVLESIDVQPTIEAVEVVHGEWKWLMRGGKTYCSKCGKLALRDQDRDDWWYYVQSDFCPHCGCKMGGAK